MRKLSYHLASAAIAILLVSSSFAIFTPSTKWTPCSKNCSSLTNQPPNMLCDKCCLPCISGNMESYNNCIRCCAQQGTSNPCAAPKPGVVDPVEPTEPPAPKEAGL